MACKISNKIAVMLALLFVVFISLLVFIQVQSRLNTVIIADTQKARLAAEMLRSYIENALIRTPGKQALADSMVSAHSLLSSYGLDKPISLYSPAGIVRASSDSSLAGARASDSEIPYMKMAAESTREKNNINCYVDKNKGLMRIYIPISGNDGLRYTASLETRLNNWAQIIRQIYIPVLVMAVFLLVLIAFLGNMLIKNIAVPISLLNAAVKEALAGDLNLRLQIDTKDELAELADNVSAVINVVRLMGEKASHTNSFTKLPGSVVIRDAVENLIREDKKFAVIFCDMDNFKMFNDKFGIPSGNEAIILASIICKEALSEKGGPDDILAHEGADDFIILTSPQKAAFVAHYIISNFDKRVSGFYNDEDKRLGYITVPSRVDNQIKKVPLMTISLAGVTNETRRIISYAEVAHIALDLRKKAKQTGGSCFIMDRRRV